MLDAGAGVEGEDRPVAADGQHPACRLNTVQGPRPLHTLRSYMGSPNLEGVVVRIRMEWLKAGDHSQASETRDILGADGLDVLDAVPHVLGVIRPPCLLVGVQGHAHGAVTDGVSEDLKAAAVQIYRPLFVLLRLPNAL